MLHVTTAVLTTMLVAWASPAPEPVVIAPRVLELAQRCQEHRGISTAAFRKHLREPKRQRAGWTVVVAGASAEDRESQATRIAALAKAKLQRVSLDSVVGKYIGETEKNLDRLLANADKGDVVLFFDEADALFGKRTEVKDAHDKYANQEVAYVVKRLQGHPDLVVVGTSSSFERLDTASARWADTVVNARPEDRDRPLPWHRLCWPPRD